MTSDLADAPLLAWGRLVAPGSRQVILPVAAKPTPRPRVTKTGIAFMPKEYSVYSADLQKRLAEIAGERVWSPMLGPLVVRVLVQKARPSKTIMAAPRGDVDNLAKGVLDAATKTKRYWEDDVQIVHLFITKSWGDVDNLELALNTLED